MCKHYVNFFVLIFMLFTGIMKCSKENEPATVQKDISGKWQLITPGCDDSTRAKTVALPENCIEFTSDGKCMYDYCHASQHFVYRIDSEFLYVVDETCPVAGKNEANCKHICIYKYHLEGNLLLLNHVAGVIPPKIHHPTVLIYQRIR